MSDGGNGRIKRTQPPDNETRELEITRTAYGFASAEGDCYDAYYYTH
jgi:hypothetical protein